jgi:hypothetical protein
MRSLPLLVAHQSAWDELILFVLPILVVLGWVRWAERRARARQAEMRKSVTNMPDDIDA